MTTRLSRTPMPTNPCRTAPMTRAIAPGRAPRTRRVLAPLAVSLLAVSLLGAACAGDDDGGSASTPGAPVVQLGGPGETNRVLSEAEAGSITVPPHTAADVAFVHAMLAHHDQALLMTALVEGRTDRDDLPLLAERMTVSQRDEIAQLEAWLDERGEPVDAAGEHAAHAGGMPGMLTVEQLDALAAASGAGFDRLFLESMIVHHEGAVLMVEELLTGGAGAQEPQISQLAQGIAADQQVEIARMKQLLTDLPDATES